MFAMISFKLALLLSCQHVFSSPVEDYFNMERRAAASSMKCDADNVLNAMRHRTPDSYSFCSSYISRPAVTTVTVYTSTETYTQTVLITSLVYPAKLYNLQRWDSTQTTIPYKSPPTPSTVSGGPCDYPHGGFCGSHFKRTLEARATTTPTSTTASGVPSYLATVPPSRISSGCSCLNPPYATTVTTTTYDSAQTTTTCTTYPQAGWTTFPAFCAPSAQVNAPAVATGVANVTTVKSFYASNKLDCCAACASVFNCVWWKFNFKSPNKDGTGDPWQPGTCQYAYNYGFQNNLGGNTPAICPNGQINLIDPKYTWSGREDSNNKPGYNQGPCGSPVGEFQSSEDFGYPDEYQFHQCS